MTVTSRPCDVGTLVLAKIAPTFPPVSGVRRSLPEPCASVAVGQLASGLAVGLPAAVRQAALAPVGSDTDPAGPSTVLSWNGWLNNTVPAAKAFGAATVIAAVAPVTSSAATVTRDTIRCDAPAARTVRRQPAIAAGCRLTFLRPAGLPADDMAASPEAEPASRRFRPAPGSGRAGRPTASRQDEDEESGSGAEYPDEPGQPAPYRCPTAAGEPDVGLGGNRGDPADQRDCGSPRAARQLLALREDQVSRLAGRERHNLLLAERAGGDPPWAVRQACLAAEVDGQLTGVLYAGDDDWLTAGGPPSGHGSDDEFRRRGTAEAYVQVNPDADPVHLNDACAVGAMNAGSLLDPDNAVVLAAGSAARYPDGDHVQDAGPGTDCESLALQANPAGELATGLAGVANKQPVRNLGGVRVDGEVRSACLLVEDQDPATNNAPGMDEVDDIAQTARVMRIGDRDVEKPDAESLRTRCRGERGSCRDQRPGCRQ